jgi:hypothetical protein
LMDAIRSIIWAWNMLAELHSPWLVTYRSTFPKGR